MAQFDLITCAGKAYQTTWMERGYLFRLAMVVFFAKIICFMLAFSLGYQNNQLAITLATVPANFVEGWLLSHYVRLLMLGHRWPFKPSGNFEADLPVLRTRARGVMSGTIVYVLINMAVGGLFAWVLSVAPPPNADPTTINPGVSIALIAVMGAMIWAFRLMWLYVPMAANIKGEFYLNSLKGYRASFPLIGVWLVCIMPFFMAGNLIGGLASSVLGTAGGDAAGAFGMILVLVAFDTIKNLVATAGITYAVMEMFKKQGKADGRA
jgi:hypothetical protein